MKRQRTIGGLLGLAAVLCCLLLVPAAPAGAAPAPSVLRLQTVPAAAGLRFSFEGQTRVTGPDGSTSFPIPPSVQSILKGRFGLGRHVRLLSTHSTSGREFHLERWYRKNLTGEPILIASLQQFVPMRIHFVNPKGGAVEPKSVDHVVVKRSDGAVFQFRGTTLEKPVLLQATRVVPLGGTLVSKDLLYRVQEVTIEGNNLVNRSQQAFVPAKSGKVALRLLFYSARFIARDRIFQFAIGSGIQLRFPNGRTHFYRFNDSGEVDFPALPRGNYLITVKAPGLKVTSPVAMTRDQVATLKVVSYLDVGVVATLMLSIAIGLLLVGRPVLRRRVRRVFHHALRRSPRTVADA